LVGKRSGLDGLFSAVRLDANATSFGDVSVQVALGDSNSACEPVSHDVATPHSPVDRVRAKPQLVGDLWNG
jgi:hypothetical protein